MSIFHSQILIGKCGYSGSQAPSALEFKNKKGIQLKVYTQSTQSCARSSENTLHSSQSELQCAYANLGSQLL